MRLGGGPTDERVARLRREFVGELRAHLLGADEHHPRRLQPAPAAIQLLCHPFQVLVNELLDVAAVARLRPTALVVLPRLFVEVFNKLLEPPRGESVEPSLFPADDGDDRSIGPGHQGHERGKLEISPDLHLVGHGLGQREGPPEVVQTGREDREPLRAVALEVVIEPLRDALPVRLQRGALLVREVLAIRLGNGGQEGVHPGLRVARSRDVGGIEVQVETGRTTVLRTEARQLPQERPRHHPSHRPPLPTINAAILCMRLTSLRSDMVCARRSSW